MSMNYSIRKLYVAIHPLLSIHSYSDRVQYIMRDKPLIDLWIPFFLEPWLNPDDWHWADDDRRTVIQMMQIFFSNIMMYCRWYIKKWRGEL